MLKSIKYENMRGRSAYFEFPRNGCGVFTLSGQNGVGKTTVIDAVAFAFTGRDSEGNAAPTHLISDGQDKMSVRIDTGKAVIERSITRKKSQNLKLIRGEAPPVSMSQEELTKLTCSQDAFLSGTVAGYFMRLPQEKALAVLREITESVDKMAVLEDILGNAVPEEYKVYLDLSKPSHTAATKLSNARRELAKDTDKLKGRLEVYQTAKDPGDEPPAPPVDIPAMRAAKALWRTFRSAEATFTTTKAQVALLEAKNTENAQKRKELESEIAAVLGSIGPEPVPTEDWGAQIAELQAQTLPRPEAPAFMNLPGSDVCPTCGQTVGLKHREQMTALNQELQRKYDSNLLMITAHNAEIRNKVTNLVLQKDAFNKTLSDWKTKKNDAEFSVTVLRKKLSQLADERVPAIPEEPRKPDVEEPTDEQISEAERAVASYNQVLGLWRAEKKTFEGAKDEISSISENIRIHEEHLAVMERIEKAVTSELDEAVFKKLEPFYKLEDDLQIVFIDDNLTVKNVKTGLHYRQFSRGQRILADARIAEKIATSLPRPLKFMFIDDYNLVSDKEIELNCQVETLVVINVSGSGSRIDLT